MHYVADLHLHSKYSRAVSKNMTLPVMAAVARQKGLDILTAADFTHPLWFKEIIEQLEEAGDGVYKLKGESVKGKGEKEILFLFSTEISSIYKQGDKLRRIHNLIFVPSMEVAEKVNKALVARGCNLNADGRPIVCLSSKALLELILSIDDRSFLIPCHIWTPHFGIYGSASGFDSLEEAFGELAPYIYGIETGLSSDPDMNWQVPELQNRTILSFSDAHSPAKMGREATVFDLERLTYEHIRKAIMRLHTGEESTNRIVYTIEFYPEEGKYHFSGHRNCKVVFTPKDVREKGTICPVCRKKLTEGVFMRVDQLSDSTLFGRAHAKHNQKGIKWYTDKKTRQPSYVKFVPLLEVIAEGFGVGVASKRVHAEFDRLCAQFGSELQILLQTSLTEIEQFAGWRIAESLKKVREGTIVIDPGYDGEFGKVKIWKEEERKKKAEEKAPQLRIDF